MTKGLGSCVRNDLFLSFFLYHGSKGEKTEGKTWKGGREEYLMGFCMA